MALAPRNGRAPHVVGPAPHAQVTDNAPVELQEQLWDRMRALAGVHVAPSMVSVPGARAIVLDDDQPTGPGEAFQKGREFAHIHPHHDGSLHVTLPEELKDEVESTGWGVRHPVQNAVLLYGPRTPEELETVWMLVKRCYGYARGEL